MKIRFRVNQAESFRRGIDAPDAIVSLEVNPALLPEDQRQLIGKHLLGTDVVYDPVRAIQSNEVVPIGGHAGAELVEAKDPRFDSLLLALVELESELAHNIEHPTFVSQISAPAKRIDGSVR